MEEKSVFADKTAKHLDATLKQAYELLELATVLANKSTLINDIQSIQQSLYLLKVMHAEEFPRKVL
ncbi:hypothetical protein EVB68_030 [Rhizobium phage RHph_Y2_6]|uniref:Uncharacterized protein n=1 Tax=Rhizobium phage RHph_Y2_6 TaxID=2509576 RepID=A0A7S5QZF1_9CAUD|nr:hypothetical protein PP748_gp030 [Rhizobium phage RHph_Y2_6]QIG68767.1 hypothetical protein EVB68_030 [Rhizobium phage RHph_Y2_6]